MTSHRRDRRDRGAVVVETAIILPVFVVLLVGILEFGLIFHNYLVLQSASREGARYGAIGHPQADVERRVRDFAFHLDDQGLIVEVLNAGGVRGTTLVVRTRYPLPLITPLMQALTGNPSFTLASESYVRLE
jgi:hypothetical protein